MGSFYAVGAGNAYVLSMQVFQAPEYGIWLEKSANESVANKKPLVANPVLELFIRW
jgi:hypothetical protein